MSGFGVSTSRGPVVPGANGTPAAAGGPWPVQRLQRRKEVDAIRRDVEAELKKSYPNYKAVYKEFGKLSKDEAAELARHLRLRQPELHGKLMRETTAVADRDTHATLFADEPILSKKEVARQARVIARDAHELEVNRVVERMNEVAPAERGEVLREIQREYPREIKELRQICRDSNDPAMRQAFRDAGI